MKSFLYCQHCDREMQMRSAKVKIPGAIIAVSKTTCTACHARRQEGIPLPGNDYDCTQCGAGVDTSYDGDGVKPSWGGWCQKCRRADGALRGNMKRRKREAEEKRQQARMDLAEREYRLKREREMVARAEQADPALASYLARRRARLGAAA